MTPDADHGFVVGAATPEFTGYAWRVDTVEITGPDGSAFTREVIRHRGAVAVLPLHDDGTVTLVRQYRASLDALLLEIPAGLRDVDGEPPEQTAVRELREEAGLEATSVEHLVSFHTAPGMTDEQMHVYLATGLTEVADDRQGPEEAVMTVERMPLAELVAMIERGEVTDAKTVVAATMVAAR